MVNDKKNVARHQVFIELRAGRIEKSSCAGCSDKSVEAHHKSYKYPLIVDWLCKRCHGRVHGLVRPLKFSMSLALKKIEDIYFDGIGARGCFAIARIANTTEVGA